MTSLQASARRLWSAFLNLSRLGRLGLLVFGSGGALDLVYHTSPAAWLPVLERVCGPAGAVAHQVTFVGMVLLLLAASRAPRPRRTHLDG